VEVELAVQLGYRFGLVKGSFLQLHKFGQTSNTESKQYVESRNVGDVLVLNINER